MNALSIPCLSGYFLGKVREENELYHSVDRRDRGRFCSWLSFPDFLSLCPIAVPSSSCKVSVHSCSFYQAVTVCETLYEAYLG